MITLKNIKYYLLIIIYAIALILYLLYPNNYYGSLIDWNVQHSIFPEYFRNIFYETKTLIPNLAINLGAGQNIFNLAYYGLFNPIFLISYLLPFISMQSFTITSSIILYILTGILMFIFIDKNFKDKTAALFASFIILSLPPITLHFHHHIMFVWYLPFLIIALLNIDTYIKTNKSIFLMISILLIILTSYFYSLSSFIALFIYGIYKMKFNIKNYLKFSLRFIIPILISMFLILPIIYTLKTNNRVSIPINLIDLLIVDFKNIFFSSFSLGFTTIILIALITNITVKDNIKNKLLNIILLLIIILPIFLFILNGGLYIRGKVLIPFIPLYIFIFIIFINNLLTKKINFKQIFLITLIISLISLLKISNIYYVLSILFSLIITYIIYRFKNKYILYIFTILFLLLFTNFNNKSEKYLTKKIKKDLKINSITKLYNKINDNSLYRSNNYHYNKQLMNKVYTKDYYNVDLYSSTYNPYYYNFYRSVNNLSKRNHLITSNGNNELINTFLGVKYITAKSIPSPYYKQIDQEKNIKLFKNENAYPIIYTEENIINNETFNKLKFPYNLFYLFKINNINKYPLEKNSYIINTKEKKEEVILPEILKNKILYISFEMNSLNPCTVGDSIIKINNISNKLTCKESTYNNKNYLFKYVISTKNMDKLKITISKGFYNITNIKVYYTDEIKEIKQHNPININKKTSTITTDLKGKYLVTSLPYDKGYKVYVNNKEVKTIVVNSAFLGAKINGGGNIKIKYNSPLYKEGKIISIIGIILFIITIYYERKKRI